MRPLLQFGRHALLVFAFASTALAQWSNDPAVNLAVGDAASDQNQVKLDPDLYGSVWVSWFDGIGTGWDVRLQRLDSEGNELFPHNGLLVADRGFSSTQDYGLDSAGHLAFLAFRDDSSGSTEITVACIHENGTALWGPSGVTLTSGAGFVASPKVAVSGDKVFVAWTENSSVKVQALDFQGVPQWAQPLDMTPAAGSYLLADMQATGTTIDEAVISIVHQTGGFTSPKHLVAQRVDGTGAPMWGANPIPIFDGGSLQFGNFPAFTMDASGGAVFSWYSASPSLQCFAQRVDSAGAEQWAHNGVACATTAGQLRVNPHVYYDAAYDDVYVTWKELNGNQSQSGVSAQRFNALGSRLWGSSGTTLKALGGPDHNLARILPSGAPGGALVVWSEAPSFGTDQLFAAHVDPAGTIDVSSFDVSSTPSGKARLAATVNAMGYPVLAWSDARTDGGDILAQAVNPNGSLDVEVVGTLFCNPGNDNSTGLPAKLAGTWLTGNGPGATSSDLHLEITDGAPGQLGYLLVGSVPNPGIPISNGNFCLGSPGFLYRYNVGGTSMNSIGGFDASGTLVNASGTSASGFGFDVPTSIPSTTPIQIVAGDTWHFQCWYRDTAAGAGSSNFSNGLSVTF